MVQSIKPQVKPKTEYTEKKYLTKEEFLKLELFNARHKILNLNATNINLQAKLQKSKKDVMDLNRHLSDQVTENIKLKRRILDLETDSLNFPNQHEEIKTERKKMKEESLLVYEDISKRLKIEDPKWGYDDETLEIKESSSDESKT